MIFFSFPLLSGYPRGLIEEFLLLFFLSSILVEPLFAVQSARSSIISYYTRCFFVLEYNELYLCL